MSRSVVPVLVGLSLVLVSGCAAGPSALPARGGATPLSAGSPTGSRPAGCHFTAGCASPQAEPGAIRYGVEYPSPNPSHAADEAALRRCLTLPGTSGLAELASLPASYQVTVSGRTENQTFRDCIVVLHMQVREIAMTRPTSAEVSGVLRAVGGPAGASDEGLPGQVVLDGPAGRFTGDSNVAGKFGLTLPFGEYTATGTSPRYGEGKGQCRAQAPVHVTAAGVVGVEVLCSRR